MDIKELVDRIDELEKRLEKLESKKKKTTKKQPETIEVWEHWKKCYLIKYKTDPVRNASINSLIKTLYTRLGTTDAKAAITMYLRDNDRYLVKNAHHLKDLVNRCESYVTMAKNNKVYTRTQAAKVEKLGGTADAIEAWRKRKNGK